MPDLQLQTYETYLNLSALRTDWAGQLILSSGLAAEGQALAFASIAAGAACLIVEADPDLCRAAARSSAVDFLVNTVDEALRVLKNEIRKHNPLTVALQAEPDHALADLQERGIYPALFAYGTQPYPALARLTAAPAPEAIVLSFEALPELQACDARLRQIIPVGDPRQRWISAAGRLFHRDRRRVISLSIAEKAGLDPIP